MPVVSRAKHFVKALVLSSRALRMVQRVRRPGVLILRYHSVQDGAGPPSDSIGPGITHRAETFRRQMELIARDFDPVTMDDVARFLLEGARLPCHAVAVTFDDGYIDNLTTAAPILAEAGVRATFYVTVKAIESGIEPWFCRLRRAFGVTAACGWTEPASGQAYDLADAASKHAAYLSACASCARRTGEAQEEFLREVESRLGITGLGPGSKIMMNWGQVRALRDGGHIVGSHTMTHPNVAQVGEGEARRELRESRDRLEAALGTPVLHFSYPNPILEPHWDARTTALAREIGYRTSVTSTSGAVRADSDPQSLRRVPIPHDLAEFRWVLERTFTFS